MLLDSYTWIEFFQGSKKGKEVEEILEKRECFTSIVSISEITEWCLKNDLEPDLFIDIIKKLSVIINLNEEIAKLAGKINFENKKTIKNWGMPDALIYASGRYYNIVTLTGDRHFEDLEDVEML